MLVAAAGVAACGAGLICAAAEIRARVGRGESTVVGPGVARCVMGTARALMRALSPGVVGAAADARRAAQDAWLADRPGRAVRVCLAGDEFSAWPGLEDELEGGEAGGVGAAARPIGALNAGVPGATVEELEDHLYAVVLRHSPRGLVLSVGSADYDAGAACGRSPRVARTIEAVASVVDRAYDGEARRVWLVLLPAAPGWSDDKRAWMADLARSVHRMVAMYDPTVWPGLRLRVADLRGELAAQPGWPAWQADEATLSPAGRAAVASALRRHIVAG
jgi:hypothetical protein